jgi:diaminopimelate decarboxylase
MLNYYTEKVGFFCGFSPEELIEKFGSPLYVYNADILKQKCDDMAHLVSYNNFKANYSVKANNNLELLKIIRERGLYSDAMSSGEIYLLMLAGFKGDEIFYVGNNVSADEIAYAVERGICVSVDSLSQLELFGRNFPNTGVAVRFNTGVGAGQQRAIGRPARSVGAQQLDRPDAGDRPPRSDPPRFAIDRPGPQRIGHGGGEPIGRADALEIR